MPLELAGGAPIVGILGAVEPVPRLAGRPIVRHEKDDRVLTNPLAFQFGADVVHAIVHSAQHRRHDLAIPGQVGKAIDVLLRCVHRVMGRIVGHVHEERLIAPGSFPNGAH